MRLSFLLALVTLILFQSCKTQQLAQTQQASKTNTRSATEQLKDLFSTYQADHQLFAGLLIVDSQTDQIIFSKNEDKYFTPASNTKLLTLLAAQHYLSDSIPAFQFALCGDSLVIRGTGDPTFLSKNDVDSVAFHFLHSTTKKIYLDNSHMTTGRFGSGWSWDDYAYYYQKENSAFPISGNATRIICHPDSLDITVSPAFMNQFISSDLGAKQFLSRAEQTNAITVNPVHQPIYERQYEIPFYQDSNFTPWALSLLLHTEVNHLETPTGSTFKTLYHSNSDSLYKDLMLMSDNFVAEQLLFLIGSELDMELNTRKIIREIMNDTLFMNIPDKPRWVDGSGLSRYNLATPQSMVWALSKLEKHLTEEQMKNWFPSGDHLGTLPQGLNQLNLYAKTGSLSNNFCLSGYLDTVSGRRLQFSWMNNHFMISKQTLVAEMSTILAFVQAAF